MRAIVVDDEPLSLAGMERMLRRQNVEVIGAFPDPLAAIREAGRLSPDAAFIDIEMPGMNGLAAAERLMEAVPELQVVFVTAYDQYAVDAFELNAADYLLKPVQTRRLETTLARLRSRMKRAVPVPPPAPAANVSALYCFSRLGVASEDGRVAEIPWRTTKAKEVFAYLLHLRDRTVSKDALLDLMWPDMDLAKAHTHLHTTVYQIRQTVKTLDLPIKLSFMDGGYRLELNGVAVDVDVWERQTAKLQSGAAVHAGEAEAWAAMYRGDYYEHEGYWWAEQERERLRIKWLECALRIAEELGGRAWNSIAFSLLTDISARFPSVQESYFLLMRMYLRQGQTQEVRKTYEQLKEALRDEAGEEPDKQITAWYEAHLGKG
ncbi:response regulator [Paenibacillus sp.]|uniref:response regulator n=1 Tax=Paenibacillus sp. TaxID=58172 RepID=UPI002D63CA2C|nr:response regulator [Paenibacillus sp.]HZG84757.1 response regulator [Paenibacillus sp.]